MHRSPILKPIVSQSVCAVHAEHSSGEWYLHDRLRRSLNCTVFDRATSLYGLLAPDQLTLLSHGALHQEHEEHERHAEHGE